MSSFWVNVSVVSNMFVVFVSTWENRFYTWRGMIILFFFYCTNVIAGVLLYTMFIAFIFSGKTINRELCSIAIQFFVHQRPILFKWAFSCRLKILQFVWSYVFLFIHLDWFSNVKQSSHIVWWLESTIPFHFHCLKKDAINVKETVISYVFHERKTF